MGSERPGRAWIVALLVLCAGTLWLQFRHIERSVPYPRHVDEAFLSGPAHRTVVTGTLHPYTFYYPSLPKYLAAAGMAAGFVRGAARQEIREIRQLGNVGYPYYEQRRPMQTARQLFAGLASVALLATGVAAWMAFRVSPVLLLAPLLLVVSPLFFFHSWTYLNVDIVGTCFVTLTLAACLAGTRRPSMMLSAILPGAFAGLATGSKYTLAVVLLPVLLAAGLYVAPGRRIAAWAAAVAAMVLAFLVAVPYSLIDIPGFLNGLAAEAFHYASGHRGFQSDPGFPQFLYYSRHLLSEFGPVGLVLGIGGFVCFATVDWRRALVLASFPAALLWLLIAQRVHFPRNVLAVQPIVAILIAFGIVCLYRWLHALADRRFELGRRSRTLTFALLPVALALIAIPVWHVPDHFRDRSDSRNLAVTWIQERIPAAWAIVVPRQLGMDLRPLQAKERRVRLVDFAAMQDPGAMKSLLGELGGPAVILAPTWGADARYPGQDSVPALNELSRRWRAMKSFGTNDVLVNYSYPNPWGDPAFAVAVLQ
jgi:4-amino-4-deoxy-L-arabinose transferase-like glycosyltransferase